MKPEFYMTQPEEVEKFRILRVAKGYDDDGMDWFTLIESLAGNDHELFSAMWSFFNFAHAFDDVLDEAGLTPELAEAAMTMLHDQVTFTLLREGNNADIQTLMLNMTRGWNDQRRSLALEAAAFFLGQLHGNLFIRRHRHELHAMFVQAMTRCLDGDEMAKSDKPERREVAPAVRCGDVDVLFHMVYLARGWAALRACGRLREYDLPDTRKEVG